MFLPAWYFWCVSLVLLPSGCGLAVSGSYKDEVICLQGLSRCTMKDETSFPVQENDVVDVQKLTPRFELCCKDKGLCTLCLVIDTELYMDLDGDVEDEGSGPDQKDYRDKRRSTKAFVTVCYKTPRAFPTCKKVKFMVNYTALTQQNPAKLSIVITKPDGVFFGSEISVFPSTSPNLGQRVVAPSADEVCGQEEERIEECQGKRDMPRLRGVDFQGRNWVELQFTSMNNTLPSMCIQYEENGVCKVWNSTTVPLYSLTPCMCLQVWDKKGWHLLSCPFKNKGPTVNVSIKEPIQRNMQQNVSVSVGYGRINKKNSKMLWWELSAPCKLEGEVWPCHQENSCREEKGFRQQLESGTWKQNSKGLWEKQGVFENVSLQQPCVMVKVKGVKHELGPFCLNNTGRWRWSLLLIGFLLLVCFTLLTFHFLNNYVKKWARSCRRGGFVRIGRKGHVVLLSPPDVDDGVSESVCRLGSLLCNHGFSVSVDQWSRKEQCTLGPLPWLHSQLLEMNNHGGRVVLVLTHRALVRTAEWAHQQPSGNDVSQIWSPYSDVFTACLGLIEREKQLGRAGERFLLVKFDSRPDSDRSLPEVLQGLPLLQIPTQIQTLLSELSVGGGGGSKRPQMCGVRPANGNIT
ncbi:uncharacterized protein LOC113163532 [Anabas testudineus]|uniref:SEFIR domain-containing protein n=1 Tax=Anabas testudineus TaxID=64144 RepID=A0A3Q1IXD6_ANATE|nr:uncharacterized protein LOC113163532 [Anabas testudineus]XP_026218052.1 uncharacterized protein LOC113163532 [Anabas testudineus]XP_026218053.1 uncharacterized protein LOC113163532 [Anabas testudineus]